jgi:alanyl-tRNA synthetase
MTKYGTLSFRWRDGLPMTTTVRVTEFSGVVTDIREESRMAGRQRWQMALDRTEFVAGDVGILEAVARSGVKLVVPVLGVVMDASGEVWHLVEKPLAAGTAVTGRVGGSVEF